MMDMSCTQKLFEAIMSWADGKEVEGIKKPKTLHTICSLEWAYQSLVRFCEYRTVCSEEIPYFKFFGFNVKEEGVGWVITQIKEA